MRRISKRIVTVIATMLLVVAMTVPAFATTCSSNTCTPTPAKKTTSTSNWYVDTLQVIVAQYQYAMMAESIAQAYAAYEQQMTQIYLGWMDMVNSWNAQLALTQAIWSQGGDQLAAFSTLSGWNYNNGFGWGDLSYLSYFGLGGLGNYDNYGVAYLDAYGNVQLLPAYVDGNGNLVYANQGGYGNYAIYGF